MIYIGQSVNIIKRFSRYQSLDCKSQVKLYRSFLKHGVGKHEFEILCQCSQEELNNLEVYYIELYNSFNSKLGMNLRSGGNVNKASDETRKKISDAGKGRIVSEETRKRSSVSRKGIKLNTHYSQERRDQISKIWKGRKHTEESKAKMRVAQKGNAIGRKASEETKAKMSASHKGRKSWNKGKEASLETKNKISASLKGKVKTVEHIANIWIARKKNKELIKQKNDKSI